MNISVFILAAGLGTRLRPLTDNLPKPLIQIRGRKRIIDFIIDWLKTFEIPERVICINAHYLANKLTKHLKGGYILSFEEELLGTAGALKKMEEHLAENFIVVNGDTLTNIDLRDMAARHFFSGAVVTVFTHDDAIHTGGVYLFNKRVLDYIPQGFYSIKDDLMPDLISKGMKVELFKPKGSYYIDCGSPKGLERARKKYAK